MDMDMVTTYEMAAFHSTGMGFRRAYAPSQCVAEDDIVAFRYRALRLAQAS